MNKYEGKDNYGRSKGNYLTKIAAMDEKALYSECYSMIYHAARCANNQRADWHWMVDACHDEATKRGDGAPIYCRAYDRCYAEQAG